MSKSNRFAALLLFVAGCATVVSNEPLKLTLGTATPGGGFQVYGAALAQSIQEADPSITIEQVPTKGSGENILLVESGKVDLGLIAGEPAHEALTGIGRPRANLKVIAAMYPTAGMFVVRSNSPYRTIQDLKGKPVAFGARASGFVVQAGYVLDALGLDRDRDFQAVYLERAGDGVTMLKDGKVAAVWGGGVGYPVFMEAAKLEGGVRFLAPTGAEAQVIVAKHPLMKAVTLPAGTYPGQAQPIATVGAWSFVFARPDLPEDAAYRVARAIHRAEPRFPAKLAQAKDSTAANTYAAVASHSLIHPGAMRYLRDAGIAR
jgi:TRAP transporter TAXI family solute receptor